MMEILLEKFGPETANEVALIFGQVVIQLQHDRQRAVAAKYDLLSALHERIRLEVSQHTEDSPVVPALRVLLQDNRREIVSVAKIDVLF